MTRVIRQLHRLAREVKNVRPRISEKELGARWIYHNARIEYPEVRLSDARRVMKSK